MAELDPGLYEDISSEDYFADPCSVPCLSQSIAHTLISKSPLHAWAQHPRFGARGKKPTREMDTGSVVHALLLGKGKRMQVITDPETGEVFQDFKKKAARELRDQARAEGFIPLLQHHWDEAQLIAANITPRLEEFGIHLAGKSELTAIWEERDDAGNVVLCRGGLDHFDESEAHIWDLKIVRSSHPRACQSHLVGFGGDIQSAAYTSAIEKLRPHLAGRVKFTFLFCEADFPHAVTPVFRMGTLREYGERRWRRGVNRWSECLRANRWPAYVTEPLGVEAPPWALAAETDLMFSENNIKPDGPSEGRVHRLHGEANGNGYDEDPLNVF
jgi:hypothetical protein